MWMRVAQGVGPRERGSSKSNGTAVMLKQSTGYAKRNTAPHTHMRCTQVTWRSPASVRQVQRATALARHIGQEQPVTMPAGTTRRTLLALRKEDAPSGRPKLPGAQALLCDSDETSIFVAIATRLHVALLIQCTLWWYYRRRRGHERNDLHAQQAAFNLARPGPVNTTQY